MFLCIVDMRRRVTAIQLCDSAVHTTRVTCVLGDLGEFCVIPLERNISHIVWISHHPRDFDAFLYFMRSSVQYEYVESITVSVDMQTASRYCFSRFQCLLSRNY